MLDQPRRTRHLAAVAPEESFARRAALRPLWWRLIKRNPRDWFFALATLAMVGWILANGLFLQPGRHPAPMFALRPVAANEATGALTPILPRPRPAELEANGRDRPRPAIPVGAAPRQDPIAELISRSSQEIKAVQRTLALYGYGQIRVTGILDAETRAAIARFERDRKMPVTGEISDRLLRELTVLAGRPPH